MFFNACFTGITSTDGTYIKSDFDINQNQLPRGGLIVSLGSTPGLGYAPLVGANVRARLNSNGSIISVVSTATTGNSIPFSTVSYDTSTGVLNVFTSSIENLDGVNQVKLVGLAFTGPSGAGIVSYFPSHDNSLNIIGVGTTSFSVQVGTSTLPHYYVGYGTIYPWYEGLNIGSGYEKSIKDYVKLVCSYADYYPEIFFKNNKLDGVKRYNCYSNVYCKWCRQYDYCWYFRCKRHRTIWR